MLKKFVSDLKNWLRPECFNSKSVPKDTIAKVLFQGFKLEQAQRHLIKNMQRQAQILKNETISCISTVIKLQEELIFVKDKHIADFDSSAITSVETPVVKSISEAVQAFQPQ